MATAAESLLSLLHSVRQNQQKQGGCWCGVSNNCIGLVGGGPVQPVALGPPVANSVATRELCLK